MAYTIPNEADAGYPDQAEPDSRDFSDIVAAGFNLTGVASGCAVTAQGSPDMTVAVASGVVYVGGTKATVSSGNLTIDAADATNARFDLICAASNGTKSVVAGTPSSNPVFPDPSGKAVLAAVYVPAAVTTISSARIVDKRVIVNPWPLRSASTYTVTNGTTDRTFNADATSIDEIADVLATLIADLQAAGAIL